MDKKSTKSDLLNKLTIDRDKLEVSPQIPISRLIILAITSAILGGILTLFIFDNSKSQLLQENSIILPEPPANANNSEKSLNLSNSGSLDNSDESANNTILNASGYITPRRMATVSAQVMGLIMEVNVEEGMAVTEGQILAQLDDNIARIRLEQSRAQLMSTTAQLQRTQASLEEAERQYQRVMKNSYSSESDKSLAETNRATSRADLKVILSNISVAKIEVKKQQEFLEEHTIRAPFNGVVTMKNAQPGEIVAPSSAGGGFTRTGICTIVDMDSLEIEVDVNESFIGRVNAGQKVLAQLDAYPDWTIPASVIAIIPTADRGKATVTVRIKIEIKDPRILPEMGVKVAFLKSEKQESI